MKENNLSSSKGIKISIIIAILLISFSVFYYLVIFIPQKNNQQLEQKLNTETVNMINSASNKVALESCLSDAQKRISNALSDKKLEESMKGSSAESQKYIIDTILKVKQQQTEECYKKYPQK